MPTIYNVIIKKLWLVIGTIVFTIIVGTLGYILIEAYEPLDAFYMTVITIATVGFREVKDLSSSGKIFTSLLILFGVSTVAYGYSVITSIIIEGELKQVWVLKRRKKMIERLKDHYIICGFGRMGAYICKRLNEQNLPFVVIEKDPSMEIRIESEGYLYLIDDSTREDTLISAGIMKAKGLVSVVSSDADNVFIVLTARQLNPDIYIISRSAEDSSEQKMLKAGANKVISPYTIGGERMALAILKPSVVDFIEVTTGGTNEKGAPLKMEEILVSENSSLCGKTILESKIRETTETIIIAVKKHDGRMEFNPKSKYKIEAGDIFIALGNKDHLSKLEDLAYGKL